MGQPTHFLPGRHWGMFVVTVPADFTTPDQRLTWTIVANGQSTGIPLRLHPDYSVSPFTDVAVKNTPPMLRFAEQGAAVQGPVAMMSDGRHSHGARRFTARAVGVDGGRREVRQRHDGAAEESAAAGAASTGRCIVAPPASRSTRITRRPKFSRAAALNVPFRGKATTTATFSEPGEYVLHVTANDYSGEGGSGEVCCWTTALVKVTVTP